MSRASSFKAAAAGGTAAALLFAVIPTGPGAARDLTADDVQCQECVDKPDIARKAVSKNRIRKRAVITDHLRKAVATPDKLALRIFDANGKVVGPALRSETGDVMIEVSSGPHAGEFFFVEARGVGLAGERVCYTLDDCKGQAYECQGLPHSVLEIPVDGWTGPDPAFGADAGGVAIRPVFFVPRSLDVFVQSGLTFESESRTDMESGAHQCIDISPTTSNGSPLDVIEDPDLSSFVPPFRAGIK